MRHIDRPGKPVVSIEGEGLGEAQSEGRNAVGGDGDLKSAGPEEARMLIDHAALVTSGGDKFPLRGPASHAAETSTSA
jgi:hypothetical protein